MSHHLMKREVLLIEDNVGDVLLVQEACRESNFLIHVDVVYDGEEAIQYLKHKESHRHATEPSLVLLDLNLPTFDGKEVLKYIKSHRKFKRIPVIVLTTSKSDEDIAKSYDYHANAYIQKPVDLETFIPMMNSVINFWLGTVQLPEI